jgi:hypothetical protein
MSWVRAVGGRRSSVLAPPTRRLYCRRRWCVPFTRLAFPFPVARSPGVVPQASLMYNKLLRENTMVQFPTILQEPQDVETIYRVMDRLRMQVGAPAAWRRCSVPGCQRTATSPLLPPPSAPLPPLPPSAPGFIEQLFACAVGHVRSSLCPPPPPVLFGFCWFMTACPCAVCDVPQGNRRQQLLRVGASLQ